MHQNSNIMCTFPKMFLCPASIPIMSMQWELSLQLSVLSSLLYRQYNMLACNTLNIAFSEGDLEHA
jgi:hypothetical protein